MVQRADTFKMAIVGCAGGEKKFLMFQYSLKIFVI